MRRQPLAPPPHKPAEHKGLHKSSSQLSMAAASSALEGLTLSPQHAAQPVRRADPDGGSTTSLHMSARGQETPVVGERKLHLDQPGWITEDNFTLQSKPHQKKEELNNFLSVKKVQKSDVSLFPSK